MKTCTKCHELKPVSEFHSRPDGKIKLQSCCKECQRAARKAWGKTQAGRANVRTREKLPKYTSRNRARQRALWQTVEGRARHMVHNARSSAKRAGVLCDLTYEQTLARLKPLVCEVSGLPLRLSVSSGCRVDPRAPSLDRVDEGGDYTIENIRIVCWQVNLARNQYGDAALLEMAEGIVRTISSRASKEEGSTTIPKGSRAKRPEAPNTPLH